MKTSLFVARARKVSWEVRSYVRAFDLGRFYRKKMGIDDMHPIAEQDDEIYDDSWFISRTRVFPNLQFAMLDQVPHAYRSTVELFSPEKNTVRDLGRSERTQGGGIEFVLSNAFTTEQDLHTVPFKIQPVLFSAHGSYESERFTLLGSISTSNLMYLDLSYTKRDSSSVHVLPSLSIGYPNLRVLKLRGLRIIDAEFSRLTQLHNGKLWSLDVRDNLLTDAVAEGLISGRFMLDKMRTKKNVDTLPDLELFDDVPDYRRIHEDRSDTAPLRSDDSGNFVKYIEKHSSFPAINDQILDDQDPFISQTGLTHLYISNNRLTSFGVELILNHANRLQVFDVGYAESNGPENGPPPWAPYHTNYAQIQAGTVYDISREACSRMEILRIHHSLVTYVPTILNTSQRDRYFTLPMVQAAELYGMSRLQQVRLKTGHKAFSPLHNYRVTKLTLTDIPTKSYGFTIERLVEFLKDCRIQEERLSEARKHTPNNRRAPQLLPGLRTLRLEFLPEDTSPPPDVGSVSGDRDAANFQASSEGDFSFFDDRNTMSSISTRGSVATTMTSGPTTPLGRKGSFTEGGIVKRATSSSSRPGSSSSGAAPSEPPAYVAEPKDVVLELKKFRASVERKWSGDLQLVFPYGR